MAPQVGSRHAFTRAVRDEDGRLFLTEREPFGFQPQLVLSLPWAVRPIHE
jgi:hypothetical protein